MGYIIVEQMYVGNAYLNADITEELYMEQPEGFLKTDYSGRELVCQLKKSL